MEAGKEILASLIDPIVAASAAATDPGASWSHFSVVDSGMPLASCVAGNDAFVLGVDEAGRGPVLGPMVYAVAYAPVSKKSLIKGIGVDDSKKLTEADREELFIKMMTTELREWMGFAVTSISPRDISEGMLKRSKYNLNSQAYDTTIALIRNTLNQGIKLTEIYVDTVGKEKPYQAILEREFPGINITVASKADSKYPIVSAASIFAKVIRDFVVKNWVFSEPGIPDKPFTREFGSGYPGDPNTKKWMRNNMDPIFGFPDIIRFSWSTCEKILQKSAAPITWPDEESNNQLQDGNISNYFKKAEPSLDGKKPSASKFEDEDDDDENESMDSEEDNFSDDNASLDEAPIKKKLRSSSGTAVLKESTGVMAKKTIRDKKRKNVVKPAFFDEDEVGVDFKFNKLDKIKDKPLQIDSSRDAIIFKGLAFQHIIEF